MQSESTSSSSSQSQTNTADGGRSSTRTDVNTTANATMSLKGQELRQIMEELGVEASADNFIFNHDVDLNDEERSYLYAVERGDSATVKEYLERAIDYAINPNCINSVGQNAVLIAIENEHIELLELLIMFGLELGDALLHAISEEAIEAVEMLLNVEKIRGGGGSGGSAGHSDQEKGAARPSTSFTTDITPIIQAAHQDNYEIIKMLLHRGDSIPKPHPLRCGCVECEVAHKEDGLRHSKSRINAYRALASPSLISLSSKDPVLTAFELSWELRRLGFLENEFKDEYEELSDRCQTFATDLLTQTRGAEELSLILNHDIGPTSQQEMNSIKAELSPHSKSMTLARLKLAIKYKQKQFVAHPHCQQLLASLWYEGLPGFRRKPLLFQSGMILGYAAFFPVLCIVYILIPRSGLAQVMRRPFIKFICHSASYFLFLLFLFLAALRIEFIIEGSIDERAKLRGAPPTIVEGIIIFYVIGFIWQEIKQLWGDGAKAYVTDMWNLLDFATNALYVATIMLRTVAYVRVHNNPTLGKMDRENWDAYDPTLISESLFAAANILSTLKLVFIFTVNPHLGPLQISLGRMLTDILKFFFVYILVLVAFSCGLNQLYWFYSFKRTEKCAKVKWMDDITGKDLELYQYCVTRGKYFTNLFEITQSLYWSAFGLIDLENTNLEYQHTFTELVGKTMFGTYCYISIVVLLNMLIAMMNSSYERIQQKTDIEWKFARSKLWISYFDEGATLPVPFNMLPTPKTFCYFVCWLKIVLCSCSKRHKKSKWKSIRKIVKKVNEKEARYQEIMKELIRRYLRHRMKSEETKGVTTDDLNEIKGDISAFRFELLEIFKTNNMIIPDYTQQSSRAKVRRRGGSKRTMHKFTPHQFTSSTEDGSIAGGIGSSRLPHATAHSTPPSDPPPKDTAATCTMNNVLSIPPGDGAENCVPSNQNNTSPPRRKVGYVSMFQNKPIEPMSVEEITLNPTHLLNSKPPLQPVVRRGDNVVGVITLPNDSTVIGSSDTCTATITNRCVGARPIGATGCAKRVTFDSTEPSSSSSNRHTTTDRMHSPQRAPPPPYDSPLMGRKPIGKYEEHLPADCTAGTFKKRSDLV